MHYSLTNDSVAQMTYQEFLHENRCDPFLIQAAILKMWREMSKRRSPDVSSQIIAEMWKTAQALNGILILSVWDQWDEHVKSTRLLKRRKLRETEKEWKKTSLITQSTRAFRVVEEVSSNWHLEIKT